MPRALRVPRRPVYSCIQSSSPVPGLSCRRRFLMTMSVAPWGVYLSPHSAGPSVPHPTRHSSMDHAQPDVHSSHADTSFKFRPHRTSGGPTNW